MDELDRALMLGWNGRESERELGRYLSRPLRSWSLVLRAGDRRFVCGEPLFQFMEDNLAFESPGVVGNFEALKRAGIERESLEVVSFGGDEIGWLCEPVCIGEPGVTMVRACEMFGVGVNTLRRWEKRGTVSIKRMPVKKEKRGRVEWPDPLGGYEFEEVWPFEKRFPVLHYHLVTTNGYIDPGGEVWAANWGMMRREISHGVPEKWGQVLIRGQRKIGKQGAMWQWLCPCCLEWCFKVFLPLDVKTVGVMLGDDGVGEFDMEKKFVCRKCAKLVYESSERGSHKEGRCVDVWDRFIQRISGGKLRGDGFFNRE